MYVFMNRNLQGIFSFPTYLLYQMPRIIAVDSTECGWIIKIFLVY